MVVPLRVRAPFVLAACVVFAFLLSTAPAAAQGALFGQNWVPEDLKPLMQKPFDPLLVQILRTELAVVKPLA